MYGIIHRAIRSTVLQQAGQAEWDRILDLAELTDGHFLSPAHFQDDITENLVVTVAGVLGLSYSEAYRTVGRHWCEYAANEGYGSLFNMSGRTLRDFLSNLDRMHSGLKVTLPAARMPSFQLLPSQGDRLELVYRSERTGLAPFVAGILEGLSAYYKEPCNIFWKEAEDGVHFTLEPLSVKNEASTDLSTAA